MALNVTTSIRREATKTTVIEDLLEKEYTAVFGSQLQQAAVHYTHARSRDGGQSIGTVMVPFQPEDDDEVIIRKAIAIKKQIQPLPSGKTRWVVER